MTPDPSAAPSAESLDLDRVTGELASVEAALERIDAGTYGSCAVCHTPIDDATLEADPTATTCAAHLQLDG